MKAPYKLTPIHDWHVKNGAQTYMAEDWVRVAHYGDSETEISAGRSNAGICDITPLAKVDIQGARSTEMLQELTGAPMPAIGDSGRRLLKNFSTPVRIVRLTSDRYWMLGDTKLRQQMSLQLADAARESGCVHVNDITSAFAAILFVGPLSGVVLKKLGSAPIDQMQVGKCIQATAARVWSLLIHCEVGLGSVWMLLVSRDYGEYVWESALAAGHEFGMRPIGGAAVHAITGMEAADVAAL